LHCWLVAVVLNWHSIQNKVGQLVNYELHIFVYGPVDGALHPESSWVVLHDGSNL